MRSKGESSFISLDFFSYHSTNPIAKNKVSIPFSLIALAKSGAALANQPVFPPEFCPANANTGGLLATLS